MGNCMYVRLETTNEYELGRHTISKNAFEGVGNILKSIFIFYYL